MEKYIGSYDRGFVCVVLSTASKFYTDKQASPNEIISGIAANFGIELCNWGGGIWDDEPYSETFASRVDKRNYDTDNN